VAPDYIPTMPRSKPQTSSIGDYIRRQRQLANISLHKIVAGDVNTRESGAVAEA
jgi:hypothetical protein